MSEPFNPGLAALVARAGGRVVVTKAELEVAVGNELSIVQVHEGFEVKVVAPAGLAS